MSTGTADQIINTKKKNEYRMFPVASAMSPTMSGPKNELDCFWSCLLSEDEILSRGGTDLVRYRVQPKPLGSMTRMR